MLHPGDASFTPESKFIYTRVIKTTYLESFPACETKGFVLSP